MWHNLKKNPPKKAGQYLVMVDADPDVAFAEVMHYFKKGDFITVRDSDKETPEERMKDFFENDDLVVRADRDGFYELKCNTFDAEWDRVINDNPSYDVYWRKLPKALRYHKWGVIGGGLP